MKIYKFQYNMPPPDDHHKSYVQCWTIDVAAETAPEALALAESQMTMKDFWRPWGSAESILVMMERVDVTAPKKSDLVTSDVPS